LRIVKWAIDPGLEGDVYADEPYLYGVAGSSFNVLRVGGKVGEEGMLGEGEEVVFEGGGGVGLGGGEGVSGGFLQSVFGFQQWVSLLVLPSCDGGGGKIRGMVG